MTEYEKMREGLLYDPMDPEIFADQQRCLDAFHRLLREPQTLQEYLKTSFASCGADCYIELPFYANWGGAHVHFGSRVYANFNLTLVDDGGIFIGDNVLLGPNVTIATATHPVEPEPRSRGLQYNRPVTLGRNVWVGAGVILLPGVTVGENSVIGAGSVVTKDIPANAVAAGNPCRVLRFIGARDRIQYETLLGGTPEKA